jgi:predicted kinase
MRGTPTVYLICGFIGAGKSTFAKRLEQKTGAVRITKDEWSIRLIGHDPAIDSYAEHDRRIIALSRDVAFQLVDKGIDVIIDEGFWSKDERRAIRKRAEDAGARAILCYLDTPIAVIRQRIAERNRNLTDDSFCISDELLDHYLRFWEPLGEDEEYILANEMT